jgi:recombination endonuclease VII
MERQREYSRTHLHRDSKESRKKSNRKYRISSYGLTLEQFDLILAAQNYACAMCHEPFDEGQLIHVDHDHACSPRQVRERPVGRRAWLQWPGRDPGIASATLA